MLSHQPGALYQALEPIARQKINLVKIESRPLVGHPWEYCFYLDLLGSPESPEMQTVLAALRQADAGAAYSGELRVGATSCRRSIALTVFRALVTIFRPASNR